MVQPSTPEIKSVRPDAESVTAEQAMNRVLDAEHRARQRVEECRMQAEFQLQQARIKSQRIGKRVDDKITLIHQRISRKVTDEVKLLSEQQSQLAKQKHLYRIDSNVLERVVERIAELLTKTKQEDGRQD